MGHLGISFIGLFYLFLLFIPNLVWAGNQPAGYSAEHENRALRLLERTGELLCTCTALIFSDYDPAGLSAREIWLAASLLLMLLYEIAWIRYFAGEHTIHQFYRALLGVPLPLATLPVAAFLLLGVYGRVVWLVLSAILLGIGHIGIHAQHWREANAPKSRIDD